MAKASRAVPRGSQFDKFLFEPIGEDGNGMPLSVLSAFARLGIDPWQEAATLDCLPGNVAARRLTAVMADLPAGSPADLKGGAMSARLIALLPGSAPATVPSRTMSSAAAPTVKSRTVMCMLFLAVWLGVQCIIASYQMPGSIGGANAPPASPVSPPISSPDAGE